LVSQAEQIKWKLSHYKKIKTMTDLQKFEPVMMDEEIEEEEEEEREKEEETKDSDEEDMDEPKQPNSPSLPLVFRERERFGIRAPFRNFLTGIWQASHELGFQR